MLISWAPRVTHAAAAAMAAALSAASLAASLSSSERDRAWAPDSVGRACGEFRIIESGRPAVMAAAPPPMPENTPPTPGAATASARHMPTAHVMPPNTNDE